MFLHIAAGLFLEQSSVAWSVYDLRDDQLLGVAFGCFADSSNSVQAMLVRQECGNHTYFCPCGTLLVLLRIAVRCGLPMKRCDILSARASEMWWILFAD